jgi:hypothetical protein
MTDEGSVVDQDAGGEDTLVYPSVARDGWEPGPPSLRVMAPSVVGAALVPLAVYYLIRDRVGSDATALAIAGVPAAGWVTFEWVRRRTIDAIGAIVLFGFLAGLVASAALGGNAFVLKVRDSVFTFAFGVACLLSLRLRRPLLFYIGRGLSAGDDPERKAAYDAMYEMPTAPRVFAIITVAWGVGLMVEAGLRIVLAATMPTGVFLAVSPPLAWVIIGSLFIFTTRYSRRARSRAEAELGA